MEGYGKPEEEKEAVGAHIEYEEEEDQIEECESNSEIEQNVGIGFVEN